MDAPRVVIVGGGITGTMHALWAVHRGWDVVHLEADPAPRRASVRNFGLVWVSGRAAGRELELALRARELWASVAEQANGTGFRPHGSLTIAREPGEWALMEEAASRPDASARGFELLGDDEVRRVNPALRGEFLGGLYCRKDAIVEPSSVLGAIRAHLGLSAHYEFHPSSHVVEVTSSGVVDHQGHSHPADVVLLCIGDRLSDLGGTIGRELANAPLRKCRLHMMQTAPAAERLSTSVADGDSLRYYPAFDLSGRSALPPPRAITEAAGMQLLLVQRLDGALTIGDTHHYDQPFDFAVDETLYDDLRSRAEGILGWTLPPVVRRWSGVYTGTTDGSICFRRQVEKNVWVVTGPAGRGMTLSPAIAEETWKEVAP